MNHKQAKKLVTDILADEANGHLSEARKKMHKDYTMTWMYKDRQGNIFPSWKNEPDDVSLENVYAITDRSYEVFNCAVSENDSEHFTVFVELIERYTDTKTGKLYQTPLVLVLEIENGKIKTGRHYCDNDLSFENLDKKDIQKAFKNREKNSFIIKSVS